MTNYDQILDFWINEVGPKGWYEKSTELDETIRQKFLTTWQAAEGGDYLYWADTPGGSLGYLILTDQFPRNMFRDDPRAFATDPLARDVATRSIEIDFDLQIKGPAQQFFYLPFEHSENMADQERAEVLFSTRMKSDNNLLHACAHKKIIHQFGRFPFRNKALGRETTEAEQVFLDGGGYQGILKTLQK